MSAHGGRYTMHRKDKRIALSVIEEKHADFLLHHMQNPQIKQYLRQRKPKSLPQEVEWIKNMQASETDFVFLVTVSDLVQAPQDVGVISLRYVDFVHQTGTSSSWFIPEVREETYGTDAEMMLLDFAFNSLNLMTVRANIPTTNWWSMRDRRIAGYREVGQFRNAFFDPEQGFQNEVLFEVLRDEWKNRLVSDW